jgi:arylsulfatase A-like enzyme
MKERGLLERTMVIFTSDHGDYNGDRRLIRKGPRMYENLLRVPLLVRMPGAAGAGRACAMMSQHEDLAPTILDLLGMEASAAMEGHTMGPALRGEHPLERKLSYFEYHRGKPQHRDVGVRDERFKLIHYGGAGRWEMYDLREDPNETVNLFSSPDSQATVERLRQNLFDWLVRTPYLELPQEYKW